MKGKYLITTDSWFIAPDGGQYQAVWGDVEIVQDSFLGIKTNSRSSNWFAKVGNKEDHVIISGCQIHYAIKCNSKPNVGMSPCWTENDGKIVQYKSPCKIYFPDVD